mmetsp:Transcript_24816/g.56580  ORF Transcript_24816/g.56580 Transcript_24816/m.56580 type:complete len:243 (+) Transcript_24816:401-1129(+)
MSGEGDLSSLLKHSYSGEPLLVSQTARRYIASRQPKPKKNHIAFNRRALMEKQAMMTDSKKKKEAEIDEKRKAVAKKKEALFSDVKGRVFSSSPLSPVPRDERSIVSSRSPPITSEFHVAFGRRVEAASSRPTSTSSHSYGRVPRYITERKRRLESEVARERDRENEPPPGFVLMDEEERQSTLRKLDEHEKLARDELRRIPFSMNLARQARVREDLEHRLKEIDDARRVFSRPKVLLQRDP